MKLKITETHSGRTFEALFWMLAAFTLSTSHTATLMLGPGFGEASAGMMAFLHMFFYQGMLLYWQCFWDQGKNKAVANQTLPRYYWILDQNLMVLLCIHNSISFGKIPNSTDANATPNHDRAATMFYRRPHWCILLTSSVLTDNDLSQRFQNIITP